MNSPKPDWKSERPYMPDAFLNNEQNKRYQFCMPYCQDKVVLDIYCGDGYGSEILSQTAQKVYGTDYSEEAIEYANILHKKDNIEFRIEKFPPINFKDNTFDTVVALEALEHTKDDNLFLSEIKRVLKDDGYLIICTPISDETMGIGAWHFREYNKEELRNLISKYFTIENFYSPALFSTSKHVVICRN